MTHKCRGSIEVPFEYKRLLIPRQAQGIGLPIPQVNNKKRCKYWYILDGGLINTEILMR
jgi:hypothetical protein